MTKTANASDRSAALQAWPHASAHHPKPGLAALTERETHV